MITKLKSLIIITACLATLIACNSIKDVASIEPSSPEEELAANQILTLGNVSDDPAGTIEDFQPIADYLAAQLTDSGIQQGKVLVASTLETMQGYLESGEVDIFFESPYGALTVYEEIGAFPIARRWKKGVDEYYSLIVVRADSNITDLDGLLGQVVSFEEIASTSGYLLPKAHLANLGYSIAEVTSANESVSSENIGYIFSGSEENVTAWVLSGKTAAGVLPIGNYEALVAEDKDQLTILTQTIAVPRHIVMASPTMDEALQEQLFELFLNMEQTPEGQSVLESFERTTRFDPLPLGPEGTMQTLEELFAPVR